MGDALLAHQGFVQAGGPAAPDDAGQDVQRIEVRVGQPHRGESDQEIRRLHRQRLPHYADAHRRRFFRHDNLVGRPARPGRKYLLRKIGECGPIQIAHAGEDDVVGDVLRAVVGAHVADREPLQQRLITEDRMAVRVHQQVLVPEQLLDAALRIVLVHLDLGDDHRPLLGEFLVGERRMLEDVRQHTQRVVEMPGLDEQVHAGEVVGGEGVDGTPVAPNLLINCACWARGGTLEDHVLQEMRDPGAEVAAFPAQPAEDAGLDRHQRLAVVLFPGHGQAVLKDQLLDGVRADDGWLPVAGAAAEAEAEPRADAPLERALQTGHTRCTRTAH